uniref:TRAM domain-containing protein n=1 Tax=Oxyrrhis marina TaxID=2969 RepID=A0A7S3UNE6_OXYMA|mmetsp:Transcript_1719/g.2550  ORF Transcript_1719/g.2550 Transcript_1719/m.2550 type:complete len:166 (+) Transcript_1719:56-553(+)
MSYPRPYIGPAWSMRRIQQFVPQATIATDIICGFPSETEQDHQETLELLKRWQLPAVNISQFYPRPGTPAASMAKLDSRVVKQRSREVTELFNSYSTTGGLRGKVVKAWFDEYDKKRGQIVGHTKQYTKVVIPALGPEALGSCQMVEVVDTSKWHIVGKLVASAA